MLRLDLTLEFDDFLARALESVPDFLEPAVESVAVPPEGLARALEPVEGTPVEEAGVEPLLEAVFLADPESEPDLEAGRSPGDWGLASSTGGTASSGFGSTFSSDFLPIQQK